MEPTTATRGPANRWAIAALVVLTGAGVVACSMETQPPPTARVERASVSVSVSASGALSAVRAQNLGFSGGGELDELLVKVGDIVQAGQVLARLDGFAAQQALEQARARLAQQQAQLDKILNGNSVEAAQRNLDQSRRVLDATRADAAAQNEQARAATGRAQAELDFAEQQLDEARDELAECEDDNPPPMAAMPQTDFVACASQRAAVDQAEANVVQARSALSNARRQQESTETTGRLRIEQARQNLVQAENDLENARRNNPADIAAQRAAVRDAEVAVTLAQQDVTNRALVAPIAGTIASINGAVGEFVSQGSQTTPLAPGSNAAIPGVTAAGGGDAGGGVANVTAPGGSSFIVLGDVDSFQVVVPFEESDAARVMPNQRVEVTFDAVPDLTRAGTVLAVAPSGTAISGVTNYYVTVALTESDPRLRDRQTAEATVLVEAVENVLTVPNAAVIRQGGQSFVNLPGPEGQPQQVPFEPGLVGDDRTEVKSGLTEGQEVQLPQATVSATPDPEGPPR